MCQFIAKIFTQLTNHTNKQANICGNINATRFTPKSFRYAAGGGSFIGLASNVEECLKWENEYAKLIYFRCTPPHTVRTQYPAHIRDNKHTHIHAHSVTRTS